MIEIFSNWAKNIILAIIIISILEMLLPNNKTKKYVKMIMGLYLLFNIIFPIIQNKDKINISEFDINQYINTTQETSANNLNQASMDKRLEEIYTEELEKDIEQKIEQKGYDVLECTVKASIYKQEETSGIQKIKLSIKNEENESNKQEEAKQKNGEINIEESIIQEVQKIKEIKIGERKEENTNNSIEAISKTEIKNLKNFLIEEYKVKEENLEINE